MLLFLHKCVFQYVIYIYETNKQIYLLLVCEVVETLSRRKVDLCCVQETRYRGGHCRIVMGKDSRYKLFWSGNNKGTAGVGVFVAEKWIEKVFEVKRVSDRIILVKIIVGQRVLCLLSVYAPQCGLSDSTKGYILRPT